MKKNLVKRSVQAALTAVMVSASLTLGTSNASAINEVPCNDGFLKITIHQHDTASTTRCFANGGEWSINFPNWWITRIETGDNRVQWYGDGRWQPSTPIGKWTTFVWPNNPGGVNFERIRIV